MYPLIQREFNPSEPRDERGRWTDGGGSDVAFISPNVSTLSIHEAVNALNGDRHKKIAEASNAIDRALGIKGENHPVIGAWSDGAENSIMVTSPGASTAQVRAASAMKGYIADQKAVLVFHPNHDGQNVLASFDVEGKPVDLHERLLKEGLSFHTLEPVGEGRFRVHVFASDDATVDTVAKVSAGFDVVPEFVRGSGEFIGTTKEDGTDREQRDDARRQYEQTIQAIAHSGALEGQDIGKTWDEIRDRWSESEAGAGESKHPGPGYSAHARLIDGVIHTSNVYDAQRALAENKRVDLKQLKQVSTLIKRLGETAAEDGGAGRGTAPTFNLCNVSVEGTNIFCGGNKGIPRAEMPVIPAKRTKEFISHLKSRGYKVEKDSEEARNLRASQSEISGAKVAASMKRIKDEGFYKRLVVSRDDYILDGHHTWAGQLGHDAKNGDLEDDDRSVKIARVDIPITKLIEEAEQFTGGKGKKPASQRPKMFRKMTMLEASTVLPPALFRKYYDAACEFFDVNAHLERRDFNDFVIVVREWDESKHPRVPGGSPEGGQFGEGGGGGGDSDSSSSEREPSKSKDKKNTYGLVPGDVEKFHALSNEWAKLNVAMLDEGGVKDPTGPVATKLLFQMTAVQQEMHKLNADPGGLEGYGLPGGPRDVLIVGAGPGGLTAAIHGAAEGMDTLVVELQLVAGGQARLSSRIENFPGFPVGVEGQKLTGDMFTQAQRLGAEAKLGVRVTKMTISADGMKHVTLSNGETIDARTLIIGGGAEFRRVDFEGESGKGVIYGDPDQLLDASKSGGGHGSVVVVGGSNGAAQAALACAPNCDHVYVVVRSKINMSAYVVAGIRNNPKIEVIEEDNIGKLEHDANGNPVSVTTVKGKKLDGVMAVGVFAGSVSDTTWVPAEAAREVNKNNPDKPIKTPRLRTNRHLEMVNENNETMPGIYAIGDMKEGAIGRVVVAAGDGAFAIRNANNYLLDQMEAAGIPLPENKADKPKKTKQIQKKPDHSKDVFDLDIANPWFGQTVDDVTPHDDKPSAKKKSLVSS